MIIRYRPLLACWFCFSSHLATAWRERPTVAGVETPRTGVEDGLHALQDHPLVGQVVQEEGVVGPRSEQGPAQDAAAQDVADDGVAVGEQHGNRARAVAGVGSSSASTPSAEIALVIQDDVGLQRRKWLVNEALADAGFEVGGQDLAVVAAAQHGQIAVVDGHRRARGLAQCGGAAGMVAVGVGQQDQGNVGRGETLPGQRGEDRLVVVQQEITAQYGVQVEVIAMDLEPADAPQRLYDQLKAAGRAVDVLINNAGFGLHGAFLDIPWERERAMLELDIVTLTHLTKLFVADMVERRFGFVLLVAPIGAYRPPQPTPPTRPPRATCSSSARRCTMSCATAAST